MFTDLYIRYGCFCTTMASLSSYGRYLMAYKAKNTIWFFTETVCQHLVWIIVQQKFTPTFFSRGQSMLLHVTDVGYSLISYLGWWDVRGHAMGLHCGAGLLIILSFQWEEHVLVTLLAQGEWKPWRASADPTYLAEPTQDQPSLSYPQT